MNREQVYRLRAPASGREALARAEPGHLYLDRETGEEMKPVSRVLPLAPSPSALLRTPENLRISPYEVRSFSLTSLTKRLRVAGLSDETCKDITAKGLEYYDAAWAEYEELHGVEHPRRFYDQMAASGS